jgi:hypothetical protein
MANPNPKTEQLTPFQRDNPNDEPLADKQIQVRLPVSLDAAVRKLGRRKSQWLRKAIARQAQEDEMI